MIIDTHAHLMFRDFDGKVNDVIENASKAGVAKIINVGCNTKTSMQALRMLDQHENLYATFGLHPYDALEATDLLMSEWAELIKKEKRIVAIGECGLDYHKAEVSKEDQMKAFRMQMDLARELHLPVVIHNREADDDTLAILDEYSGKDGKRRVEAVFHCYGSDVSFARKLWYRGYYTSFTGIITFNNAADLIAVVDECPMDAFMVETDCPYLAPQKYRGMTNEPAYVTEVVTEIAEIKDLHFEEVARMSTQNAMQFFLRMAT